MRGLASILVAAVLAPAATAFADPGPALSVDAAAGRHAISPLIYGWNFAPPDLAAQIDLPVDRRGGNSADTLNWQTGVENRANDYFFENLPWCWDDKYGYCGGGTADPALAHRAYTDQIDRDRAVGAKSLIDLPMLGYVPKAPALYSHPFDCSFPKTAFANQDSFDPYDTNCGNGHRPAPNQDQWVTGTAQLADAQAEGPDFQGAWIDDLVSRYGSAASGGVAYYELGNEPGLWDSTHHDWHPQPTSAQELWDDMRGLAQQVKQHDQTAQTVGPAEWGWPSYFCSAKDGGCGPSGPSPVPGGSDWAAVQGNKPLIPWLLSQFKDWADAHGGQRLLDYVDVHYYRQDTSHRAGIEATRSLWAPSYTDDSWIGDQIQLIPRMHQWVDQSYPGTKLSLSEYDLAVDSGADDTHADLDNLIEADVLGIFGRERLDMATLWPETGNAHYADAFRLFRNYDGSHSKFGDSSVSSQSGDQSKLAVYGAQRSSDGALTLVVINKTTGDLTSTLSLAGFTPGGAAQVWRWAGVSGGIQRAPDQPVDSSGFSATFPARSMTMVVVPAPPVGSETPTPGTSAPAKRCRVPKLGGLTLEKAKAKLRRSGCRLGKVTKKKSRKRRGTVIRQTPRPRAHVKIGTRVRLVLSRGR